jgi:hypothetical protein
MNFLTMIFIKEIFNLKILIKIEFLIKIKLKEKHFLIFLEVPKEINMNKQIKNWIKVNLKTAWMKEKREIKNKKMTFMNKNNRW